MMVIMLMMIIMIKMKMARPTITFMMVTISML